MLCDFLCFTTSCFPFPLLSLSLFSFPPFFCSHSISLARSLALSLDTPLSSLLVSFSFFFKINFQFLLRRATRERVRGGGARQRRASLLPLPFSVISTHTQGRSQTGPLVPRQVLQPASQPASQSVSQTVRQKGVTTCSSIQYIFRSICAPVPQGYQVNPVPAVPSSPGEPGNKYLMTWMCHFCHGHIPSSFLYIFFIIITLLHTVHR